MKRRRFLAALSTGCSLAVLVSSIGQVPLSAGESVAPEIKILQLARLQAADAQRILLEIFADAGPESGGSLRLVVGPTPDSLIAVGSQPMLERVEALVKRFDMPQDPKRKTTYHVIPLDNLSAPEILGAAVALGLADTQIQAETVTNSLMVAGPLEAVAQVKQLVASFEERMSSRQAAALKVRIVWLVDGSLAPEDAAPVPADLKETIAPLSKKLGIGELRTAAQLVIGAGTSDGSAFNANGTARLAQLSNIQVSGAVNARNNVIEIQIAASDCNLQTSIKALPGRPVIVGITSVDSKPTMFVVELMQEDDGDEAR